jgi:hypothetical protein
MDSIAEQILMPLLTGYFVNLTSPILQDLIEYFKRAFQSKPELENDLKRAKTPEDFEKVFTEAFGVINALAGNGSITVSKSSLEALRGIRFDHQNGKVVITGSTVYAPLIQVGGTGLGQSEISTSVLKSQGAQVECNGDANILMMGDAQITMN